MKVINVAGAAITNDGKILCAQRGSEKSLVYKWEFPGGKVETGETPKKALKREVREELKCEVDVGEQVKQTIQDRWELISYTISKFIKYSVKQI